MINNLYFLRYACKLEEIDICYSRYYKMTVIDHILNTFQDIDSLLKVESKVNHSFILYKYHAIILFWHLSRRIINFRCNDSSSCHRTLVIIEIARRSAPST